MDAGAVADDVARRSYGKLVAFLAARTRDVAAAEDALAEAFAAALVDWPAHGCPVNPEAWLLTAASEPAVGVTLDAVVRMSRVPRQRPRSLPTLAMADLVTLIRSIATQPNRSER